MKLAIVSTMRIYPWGGSEELWYATAIKALERGDQVDCYLYNRDTLPKQHERLRSLGARLHYIQPLKGRISRLLHTFVGLFSNPYQNLIRQNYDKVLISQGGTFEVLSNDALLSVLNQLPAQKIVIVSHGNQNGLILTAKQREVARKLFSKVQHTCFVSKWALALTESQILSKLNNASIVINPYKNNHTVSTPPPSEPLRMAMVSSLSIQWKGQDILLEVLAKPTWQNRDWQLEVYGEGKDQQYLSELIRFYHLESKVRLMGHEDNLTKIWQNNAILICPSRVDNVPIALMEAMACARTALVTNIGGMTEWIDHHIGFIAEGPTTESLAIAMETMWQHKTMLHMMGQSCKERFEAKTRNQSFDLLSLL